MERLITVAQAIEWLENDMSALMTWLDQFDTLEMSIVTAQLKQLREESAYIKNLREPGKTYYKERFLKQYIGM